MIDKNKIYTACAIGFGILSGYFLAALSWPIDFKQFNSNPKIDYKQYSKVIVDKECPIKAKQGKSKGVETKIYHLPGSLGYSRIKATECFFSEGAAQAAGYVRSKR